MAERVRYTGPALVGWGPVVAGAVIGLGVMMLLNTFWAALADGSGIEAVETNMHWFTFASAVAALLLAGLFAGWLSGVPGAGAGVLNGLTVWGLVLIALAVFPIPQGLRLFETFTTPLPDVGAGAIWASFFALLIGLAAAALGGLIGGGLATTSITERSTTASTASTASTDASNTTVPPQRTDGEHVARESSDTTQPTDSPPTDSPPTDSPPTDSHEETEAGRE